LRNLSHCLRLVDTAPAQISNIFSTKNFLAA
jgi:hypothetical protein